MIFININYYRFIKFVFTKWLVINVLKVNFHTNFVSQIFIKRIHSFTIFYVIFLVLFETKNVLIL